MKKIFLLSIAIIFMFTACFDKSEKNEEKVQNEYTILLEKLVNDFIVTSRSKEILEKIKLMIKEFLEMRGLELSESKTVITHIDIGFDFIGFNFRKYKDKLLIQPSKKSLKNIVKKIKSVIKKHTSSTQEELIKSLNPIIRGWCNYHNSICSKLTYNIKSELKRVAAKIRA